MHLIQENMCASGLLLFFSWEKSKAVWRTLTSLWPRDIPRISGKEVIHLDPKITRSDEIIALKVVLPLLVFQIQSSGTENSLQAYSWLQGVT
jgi:hypothetical protein